MNSEQTTNTQHTQAPDPNQTIDPAIAKRNKRGFGLLMIAGGVFLMWINWNSALSSGTYWPTLSVLAPTVIGIGVSTLVFPQRKTHNALGFVGFVVGIMNWLFISGTL
jgi:predicted phage tail protein